jgi:hypothetical protein
LTAENPTAPDITVHIFYWLSSGRNANQLDIPVIIRGWFEGAAARATYIGIAMLA